MRWLSLAVLSIMLWGCISPEGIAPHAKPQSLDRLTLTAELSQQPAPFVTRAWWQDWGDPNLTILIDTALADNPGLAEARARLAEAAGHAEVAGARLDPQAGVALSTGLAHWSENQFFPPPFGGSTTWNNSLNFSLNYSLDLWGEHRAQAQGAIDQTRAAACAYEAARLALIQAIVHDYLQYAHIRGVLAQESHRLSIARQTVAIEHARLAHGLLNDQALLSAQQTEDAVVARIAQGQSLAALTAQRLAALTGQGAVLAVPLPAQPSVLATAWAMPANIPANWIAERPDVRARRWQVAAAAEGITVARARFYPNIDLTAYLGGLAAAHSFIAFLQPGSINLGLTPAIRLPLFDGGALRGTLKARSAEYDAAVAVYNQSLITALTQTSAALTALKFGAEQRALATQTQALAERALDQAKRRYRAGLTNALPVLAAEDHLASARQNLLSINAAGLDALAALYTALGGGIPDQLTPKRNAR
ncbi:efflux transporter outer membrane subunit [Halothiobacillus sp. DCM-1]|uniref:efflux transporter outer membrane subunit n=1 Tax=Halothiobacillus sp. DCM-1 TaxID=3112558 RepID=UPI00324C6AA9